MCDSQHSFKHKLPREAIWHSSGGLHHNDIDCILIRKRCRSRIYGAKTRVFPGADVGSEHDLLVMTMKVKLTRRQRRDQAGLSYDVEQLNTLGGKSASLHLLDNI